MPLGQLVYRRGYPSLSAEHRLGRGAQPPAAAFAAVPTCALWRGDHLAIAMPALTPAYGLVAGALSGGLG